ncbi:MAG: PHP domain-containing protein [Balneolaceae bacterium]
MGKADLHTHTTASDGAFTPEKLIRHAHKKGLETISITDHDTIKGYLQAKPIAQEVGIELLPGVEITASWMDMEAHILAYCFDETDTNVLNLLLGQKRARKKRMVSIVNHLQKQGVDIDIEEVKAEAGRGNIGRPHAAEVMVNKKIVASFGEAFIRYLSSEKLQDIETEYSTLENVIEVIQNAGGVLSLAHPGPIYSSRQITKMISMGIDGIECIHPSHNFAVQRNFTKTASSNNLLVTGGSDFHGKGKSDYDPYFGIVTLGEQHVFSLKRMAQRRKEMVV